MTHVVVIGHSGQVASELRGLVLPTNWRMTSLSRHQLNLSRPYRLFEALEALNPDVLINAAAYTHVDNAEIERELAHAVNAQAPEELAWASKRLDIPFLHISTDYVFDGMAALPWREGDDTLPLNVYGRSKLAGEFGVLASGARAVIVRTSWVFSPFGQNFVKTMLKLAADRPELSIVSDQRGSPTAACDIAKALLVVAQRLVEHPDSPLGVYHYCGRPSTSWAEFAEEIFANADWLAHAPVVKRISTAEFPTRARRPRFSVLDCSKLKHDYGIEQPDWHIGLSDTLERLRPQSNTVGDQ
jgi:dTDP-4-dehydrorhamnose reductase